ncbi:MAG: hypothetical protein M3Y49_16060 [Actinomycetota bacterium]|nr:hypothetical protein [Actinomycetota bacterium]
MTVTAGIGFPHAQQVLQITRGTCRIGKKKWVTETVYAMTDLSARQAGPQQLATWIRGHRHIENNLHWVRRPPPGSGHPHMGVPSSRGHLTTRFRCHRSILSMRQQWFTRVRLLVAHVTR